MQEEETISFKQDFEKENEISTLLASINKNIIIQNTLFTDGGEGNTDLFFFKLDLIFKQLARNGHFLTDTEKIEIGLCKGNEHIVRCYMASPVISYDEFQKLFDGKAAAPATTIEEEFNVNEWVRVFENESFPFENEKSETGYILKVFRDGFYEIVCKGKVLKIHASKMIRL